MTDSVNEAGSRVDTLPADKELYPQLMSLNRDAWRLVDRFYSKRLSAYFFRKNMLTTEDRQDAIQETFVRFFNSLMTGQYDPNLGNLSQWMHSIARMVLLEHKRQYASEYSQHLELSEEQSDNKQVSKDSANEDTQTNPHREQLSRAFDKLSDKDQEVVRIKINADNRTWTDIAQELGISESAAKMRYTRALKKLEHLLS